MLLDLPWKLLFPGKSGERANGVIIALLVDTSSSDGSKSGSSSANVGVGMVDNEKTGFAVGAVDIGIDISMASLISGLSRGEADDASAGIGENMDGLTKGEGSPFG